MYLENETKSTHYIKKFFTGVSGLGILLNMGFSEFIQNNRPRQKPELWAHLARALWRHVKYAWWCTVGSPRRIHSLPVMFDGDLRIRVIPSDAIGRAIYLYGVYELAVTRLLTLALQPGDTFADVGAHRGYYTLLAAKRVGPQGRVFAFEPASFIFRGLHENIQLNQFSQILIRPLAVCNEVGARTLYAVFDEKNSGLSSLKAPPPETLHVQAQRVESTTLDYFFSQQPGAPIPDLIKVDVEGAEREVFDGARGMLSAAKAPDIIFETQHDSSLKDLLKEYGYHIFDIGRWPGRDVVLVPEGITPPISVHRSYEPTNAFATKALKPHLQPIVYGRG